MENEEIIVELRTTMYVDKEDFYDYLDSNFNFESKDNYIDQLKTIIYNFLFTGLDNNEIPLDIDNIIDYEQIENKMLNWSINYLISIDKEIK